MKKLQPVHYLNEKSNFSREYTALFNDLLVQDDVPDEYVNDVLNRLSFMKPLRETMNRLYIKKSNEKVIVSVKKNFHDEQEWRYVPQNWELESLDLDSIIANLYVIGTNESINELNRKIEDENIKKFG